MADDIMDFRRCQDSITESRLWLGTKLAGGHQLAGVQRPLCVGNRSIQQRMRDKLEATSFRPVNFNWLRLGSRNEGGMRPDARGDNR